MSSMRLFMDKIKRFSFKYPVVMSAAVFFLASLLCIISKQPVVTFFEQSMDLRKATWLFFTVYQAVWAVAMIPLIKGVGIGEMAGFRKVSSWRPLWLCLPPIALFVLSSSDILSGDIAINAGPVDFILYILLNLSVGFYEELIGRSFVLNLLLQKWGKTKKGIYLAVFISSLMFGLIHLTTVILGKRELVPGIGQAIFCIFFGVFFAGCLLRFQSIWPPIFLHTLFDLFGASPELTAKFGEVQQSTPLNTLINVLFLLPVLLCGILLLRKVKPCDLPQYDPDKDVAYK